MKQDGNSDCGGGRWTEPYEVGQSGCPTGQMEDRTVHYSKHQLEWFLNI